MTSRERIKQTLNFQIPDRVGVYDCLWDQTEQNWKKQNLLPDGQPYQDFFSYDLRLFEFDQSFLLMEKEAAVRTKKDWQDFKVLLTACQERIDSSFENSYKAARDSGRFLTLAFLDPFQHAASIFGLQNLLTLVAEDPALLADVFSTSADLTLNMYRLLGRRGFVFDGAWAWCDLAYKDGCYFSAKTYKALLYPHHKRIFGYFNSKEIPVLFHCDGNCLEFVPLLLKAGIRSLNPLQTECGFTLESLKSEYGKDLVLFGNMPTDALAKDKKHIEDVFAKRLDAAKKDGGFIYHGDKPIPPTVSFENYIFALEMVKKYGSY